MIDQLVAIEANAGDGWEVVGEMLGPDDPPGSISSNGNLGVECDVYVFGWLDDAGPGVWCTPGGADRGPMRGTLYIDLDQVADLTEKPYEFTRIVGGTNATIEVRIALRQVTVVPPTVTQLGDPRGSGAGWQLLPAAPGLCSQCAIDHEPELPHNPQSMHYQYAFYAEHGRWPTWEDALAHCDDEMYEAWRAGLAEHDVHLPARA